MNSGLILATKGSGASDPYFNNVIMLIHGSLNDVKGGTFTTTGAVTTSTAQSKVGTSAIYVPSGGSFKVTPSITSTFGTNDFTIEMWIYYTNNSGTYQTPFANNQASPQEIQMRFGDSGFGYKYQVAFGLDGQVSYLMNSNYTTSQLINGWHNYAISRQNGTAYVFVDGILQATASRTDNFSSQPVWTMMSNMVGYIQEVRITNNVCRYSANYTPSTTPFPNH